MLYDDPEFIDCFSNTINHKKNMFEFIKKHDCYLNLPDMEIENNPLNMEVIKNKQSQDSDLERWKNKYPNEYFYINIGDVKDILCHCKPGKDKKEH